MEAEIHRRLASWLRVGLWAIVTGVLTVLSLRIVCVLLPSTCAPIYSVIDYAHKPVQLFSQPTIQWLGRQLGVKQIGMDAWTYPEGVKTILRIVEAAFYFLYWFLLGVIANRVYIITKGT